MILRTKRTTFSRNILFFFNDTATTEIYTLSLHDALPIFGSGLTGVLYVLDEPSIGLHQRDNERLLGTLKRLRDLGKDRKSTRLNSSHANISYAVFCLKKKPPQALHSTLSFPLS